MRNLSLLLALVLSPASANAAPFIELFTSQGCYSCPPADEFLADLIADKPEVVALEFHVDYWDDLHYGAAGVWKDPFSDASYSARQRRYNSVDLRGNRGVYTPQMIINGNTAQVGSSRRKVLSALNYKEPEIKLTASLSNDLLSVDIEGERKAGSKIWLAIFNKVTTTEVERGENHGKTMVNHHVVRQLIPLGSWQGKKASQTFQVSLAADENTNCAVFLQDDTLGQVQGATYCR